MRLVSIFYESNVFILEKNNEVLIVDCGIPASEIKKHIGNKKVVGVLLTHGHFDHAYYVEEYANTFDTKIYLSEFAKEYLEDNKKNYSCDYEGLFLGIKDFSKFCFLSGNGKTKVGNFEVKYMQLGGHSKSDMGFLVDGELFMGDVIIGRGIGRMDLYGGNKEEMLKSLKSLSKVDYEIMHCGHGEDCPKTSQDKVISTYIKFLSR